MDSEQDGFQSPEEAALAGWASTPSAHARVMSVEVVNDRAQVVVAADGDPYANHDYVYCVRRDGRWREVVSGSGRSEGCQTRTPFEWD